MQHHRTDRYQSMFGAGDAYGYYHEEDESSFNLVNSQKKAIGMFQKKRWQVSLSRTFTCLGVRVVWGVPCDTPILKRYL